MGSPPLPRTCPPRPASACPPPARASCPARPALPSGGSPLRSGERIQTNSWVAIGSRTWSKYPSPRLRPRPTAQRSGASLGAWERGLARAAWAGGAAHPLPRVRATTLGCGKKGKFDGQVKRFVSCPFVFLCRLQRPRATSFVSFSQPTSNASHKVSF